MLKCPERSIPIGKRAFSIFYNGDNKVENTENIILTGYMGSGKTSVSRELERITELTFLDTDAEIERRAGKTISRIFAEDGEEAFRMLETGLLEEYLQNGWKGILSTGGGMPVREENRKLLRKLGKVIYLQTSAETICDRLSGDTTRPLLAGLADREAKLSKIREMLSIREPYYLETAHITVKTDGLAPGAIAEKILQNLDR